jgi:rubrerythrin
MPTATKIRKAKTAKRKAAAVKKHQKLSCPECGLIVAVDNPCDCPDLSGLACCGTPMRRKK